MSRKFNGLAPWIVVAFLAGGVIYNIIITRVVYQNDFKHLQAEVKTNHTISQQGFTEIKLEIRDLRNYLLEKK